MKRNNGYMVFRCSGAQSGPLLLGPFNFLQSLDPDPEKSFWVNVAAGRVEPGSIFFLPRWEALDYQRLYNPPFVMDVRQYRFFLRNYDFYPLSTDPFFKPVEAAARVTDFSGIQLVTRRYIELRKMSEKGRRRYLQMKPAYRNVQSENDYFDRDEVRRCYIRCSICGKEVDYPLILGVSTLFRRDRRIRSLLSKTAANHAACSYICRRSLERLLYERSKKWLAAKNAVKVELEQIRRCKKLMQDLSKTLAKPTHDAFQSLQEEFEQVANLRK